MNADWRDRFWAKVTRRGPDECWMWKATPDKDGYGRFWLDGRNVRAHRLVFFLEHGRWPEPLACHRCDTPGCCNPGHIFAGSHAENQADMTAKGRGRVGEKNGLRIHPHRIARGDRNGSRLHPESRPRGERHWKAKLSEQDVEYIRANYAPRKVTQQGLAERFGVGVCAIGRILRGESRKVAP